ncbi:MAG: ferritin family protein [Bacteroidales bacterium]|nr:ferritin family protein [Bacteroidales bacterium]
MKTFNSLDEILDFAMKSEQDAVDFYTSLAEKMQNAEMKAVFLQFAKEEVGHKARLQKIKDEQIFDMEVVKINDLKISDYVVSAQPTDDMEYRDALVLAMKREKAAFKLYTKLSERTDNPELKKVFMALAVEESKHKLRFELEYDDFVMREN